MKKNLALFFGLLILAFGSAPTWAGDKVETSTKLTRQARIDNCQNSLVTYLKSHIQGVQTLAEKELTTTEKMLLLGLKKAREEGLLEPAIDKLFESEAVKGRIGADPKAVGYLKEKLKNILNSHLELMGITGDNNYFTWQKLAEIWDEQVATSGSTTTDDLRKLTDEIVQLTFRGQDSVQFDSPLSSTTHIEALINGVQSFAKRNELIEGAKKSVYISVWGIYDDNTGQDLLQQLIKLQKDNKGIDIRIMVDGQVAKGAHHNLIMSQIKDAGIPTMKVIHSEDSYFGMHRKFMVIDSEHLILGGMNFGDLYSHHPKAATETPKWRDTDVYAQGSIVEEAQILFAQIWNKNLQRGEYPQEVTAFPEIAFMNTEPTDPTSLALLIDNVPNEMGDDKIMLTYLKLISASTSSVKIENAYVISHPAIENALKAAIERGVSVQVLTNSNTSVDEPIVSTPIALTAKKLTEMGAKVFLRKGSTLHSKFMIVDDKVSFIGSYNLHPRSTRMEGELNLYSTSVELANQLSISFASGTSEDKSELLTKDSAPVEVDPVSYMVLRLLFDQI